ncbi:hypothetical protein SAY86_006467 [Trapa natans]|uniref:Uncharacterized protein n=1 Tax=Trapa natans TaxID=22666 RepID=A0AAN7QTB6_TRANT|nr:hypothetical protein SAY86_006467 [Trapa natans]
MPISRSSPSVLVAVAILISVSLCTASRTMDDYCNSLKTKEEMEAAGDIPGVLSLEEGMPEGVSSLQLDSTPQWVRVSFTNPERWTFIKGGY